MPAGFALDETHVPHVTMLQRYVRHDDLDRVFAAVEGVIAANDVAALRLQAVAFVGGELGTPPGTALASIVIEPMPALTALHQAIVEAVGPFGRSGGTAAAFVTTADEPGVNRATIAYVEGFVPSRAGELYDPHMTVGVGRQDVVKGLEAAPFDGFEFSLGAVSVYRLGNLGAARTVLKSWPLRVRTT